MKPMIFCLAAGILALAGSAALADDCSPYRTSEAKATDPLQITTMMDAKTAIKAALNDPHVSFKEIYFCKTSRDQIAMACGQVKSGRSGKGYVRFLSGGRADMTSWEGDGKEGFDAAWNRFCKP